MGNNDRNFSTSDFNRGCFTTTSIPIERRTPFVAPPPLLLLFPFLRMLHLMRFPSLVSLQEVNNSSVQGEEGKREAMWVHGKDKKVGSDEVKGTYEDGKVREAVSEGERAWGRARKGRVI